MKMIFIHEDNVTTLGELAEELAKMYGWTSYEVKGDTICFETDDGAKHRVDTSGFAQTLENSEWVDDDELNVNWDETPNGGYVQYIWAEDENGNTVMLHD